MNNPMRILTLAGCVFATCVHAAGVAGVDGTDPVVATECRRISDKLASIDYHECSDKDLQPGGGYSVLNVPLLIKEYPPLTGKRKPLGRVLLIGGIHGDEYSSISIVFKWMNILDQHHSGMFHWQVVPLLNPDGLLQKKATRVNANGVDLNRNFPTQNWEQEAEDYWVTKTNRDPRRFPGKSPLSEPESRWLSEKINTFQPDVIVTVHAPYGVVDYDGPPDAPSRLGGLYLYLLGTYPGSLGRFAGVHRQIPVVTIELPNAGIMPRPAEINAIWGDLINWLRKNTPAAGGRITLNYETDPS